MFLELGDVECVSAMGTSTVRAYVFYTLPNFPVAFVTMAYEVAVLEVLLCPILESCSFGTPYKIEVGRIACAESNLESRRPWCNHNIFEIVDKQWRGEGGSLRPVSPFRHTLRTGAWSKPCDGTQIRP